MRPLILLMLSALCLVGCVSSRAVTTAGQYEEINALGEEKSAVITLMADTGKTDCDGDFLSIGRDSVQWVDPGTGLVRSAATAQLRCIRFTMRNAGALTGALVGFLSGAGIFTIGLAGSAGKSHKEWDTYGVIGLAGAITAIVGLPVGAIIGALIGNKTDYVFGNQ
jgi:hypothetical protein